MPDSQQNKESGKGREDSRSLFSKPWPWLVLGLLFTIACLFVAGIAAMQTLRTSPGSDVAALQQSTIIVLTAPPRPVASATAERTAPTPVPTFTPIVTPDTAIAPPELTVGFYAVVANTDNLGVTIRGGPGTENDALAVQPEGALVLVIGGPQSGEDFQWWQVQLIDQTEGWTVSRFLEPAAGP